jgi:hypothetical protein
MIREISAILKGFRSCFARAAAPNWFAAGVFDFLVRIDLCGATAFVRWLGTEPAHFPFFSGPRPGAAQNDLAAMVADRVAALSVADHRRSVATGRRRHQHLQGGREDAGGQAARPGVRQLRHDAVHLWSPLWRDRHFGRLGIKNSSAFPFAPSCMKE